MSNPTGPFKRATRSRVKVKIGITGPSGSGKTDNAIRIARMLVGPEGKIAGIDTENESMSLYSDITEFDAATLTAPFTSARYKELMQQAVDAGYHALIIDSISHQWAGSGGILERKDELDASGAPGAKNTWANWNEFTKEHNDFIQFLVHLPLHVICTLRTKTIWETTKASEGQRAKVEKIGTSPIQREGTDYEFSLIFDLQLNHKASATKDRTGIFMRPDMPKSWDLRDQRIGKLILEWLESGAPEAPKPAAPAGGAKALNGSAPTGPASEAQKEAVRNLCKHRLISEAERKAVLDLVDGLTIRKALAWVTRLEEMIETREAEETLLRASKPQEEPKPGPNSDPATFADPPAALAEGEQQAGLFGDDPDSEANMRGDIVALLGNPKVPQSARTVWGELYHGTKNIGLDVLREIRAKLKDALARTEKQEGADAGAGE